MELQFFLATAGLTVLLLASRTVESESFHDLADTRAHLIAAVSHELRTPLTPILGFSELLLKREQLDPQTRQGLEVIHRNGRHLTSLVEDLLRASRARRGAMPVHPEEIRIATIVDELLVSRPGEAIEVSIAPPEARAWFDKTHLIQILTNLLENATRHGRAPVVVRATSDGEKTHIVVADQGEGVPEWFVANLFDEFAQATHGNQRPSLGLGLGLPIARSLALANNGDLTHRQQLGETQFVVHLPTVRTSTVPTRPSDSPTSTSADVGRSCSTSGGREALDERTHPAAATNATLKRLRRMLSGRAKRARHDDCRVPCRCPVRAVRGPRPEPLGG